MHRDFEMDAVAKTTNPPVADRAVSATHDGMPILASPPHSAGAAGWMGAAAQPALASSPGVHRSVLQLQRMFGNQYVQRMALIARQAVGPAEAGQDVEHTIQSRRGGGAALDSPVRGRMEKAFGADFSGVRIHQDHTANALNHSLQARAFTTGQDIFFRQGAYQPGSSTGRELIAHELTHVVQQNGDRVEKKIQTKMSVSQPGDAYEVEADRMAQAVMRQESALTPAAEAGGRVDRQPETPKHDDDEKKKIHRACACGGTDQSADRGV